MPRNAESFESGQAHRKSAATRAMATRAFWKTVARGSIIFWLETAAFRHRYALTIISAISAALITTSMRVKARREQDPRWGSLTLTTGAHVARETRNPKPETLRKSESRSPKLPIRWPLGEPISRELPGLVGSTPERAALRSEEHTSELQSRQYLVCRLLLEKK